MGIFRQLQKPGNIMLTKAGVKLMDFGLAKSAAPQALDRSSVTASINTRVGNQALTAEGTLVGTFQYISPEQLEGKEADARSDIFALGTVLYEMATGKRVFEGKTTASVVAAVLASQPQPVSALQPLCPLALDKIIRTCLAKDPDDRFQSVHDVKLQLTWIAEGGSQSGAPASLSKRRKSHEGIAWTAAACALVAFLMLWLVDSRCSAPEAHVLRFTIPPPDNTTFDVLSVTSAPVISPDGRTIAFVARSAGVTQIWLRTLDSFKPSLVAGTEGAYGAFWSPDGRNLAFFVVGKLKRVATSGGPVVTVCDIDQARGGSWNREDAIVFAKFPGEIYRVPASGGQPKQVTRLDTARHESSHRWPYFLPDGEHFLYMAGATGLAGDENLIKVGALDGGPDKVLLNASSPVAYDSGFLLFVVNRTLTARRFDAKQLDFLGDPITVAEDVVYEPLFSNAVFSASGTGALLYQTGNAAHDLQLELLDASGKSLATLGEPGRMFDLRISPDGNSVAFSLIDPNSGKADIWTQNVSTGNRTRITRDVRISRGPVWSRDGTKIAYYSMRIAGKPTLYMMPSNGMGVEEKIWEPNFMGWPDDWTPDPKTLVVDERPQGGTNRISLLTLGQEGQTAPLLVTPGANVHYGRPSVDGHWIAYESDESGRREVYVSNFQKPAGRLQASLAGGRLPSWRGDGKELYYIDGVGNLIAAELKMTTGLVEVTGRHTLFQFKRLSTNYDAFPDGKKFLTALPKNDTPVPLSMVLNWAADLKK